MPRPSTLCHVTHRVAQPLIRSATLPSRQVVSFEINKIGQGFTATAYKIECKLAGGGEKVVIAKLPHEFGLEKQKQHANDCKIEACAHLSVFMPGCLPASCLRAGPNAGPKSDGRGGPAGGKSSSRPPLAPRPMAISAPLSVGGGASERWTSIVPERRARRVTARLA